MIHEIPRVQNNRSGYEAIAALAAAAKPLAFDQLTVDFSGCDFFAANMAAPLGAVLAWVENDLNTVSIRNVPQRVEKILRKNGFLATFGYEGLDDDNRTTLPYARIRLTDESRFESYINRHVKGKGIPSMTDGFGGAFKRKLYEIFENAVMHSASEIGMCICGQYFPQQEHLDITLADAGKGIRENVRRYLKNPNLSSVSAIRWALLEGNSTKEGTQPGGLGLKFLHDFINMNKGRIHIVSRYGYYEFCDGKEEFGKLASDFPGTVVNVQINTRDTASYCLDEELTADDIF